MLKERSRPRGRVGQPEVAGVEQEEERWRWESSGTKEGARERI